MTSAVTWLQTGTVAYPQSELLAAEICMGAGGQHIPSLSLDSTVMNAVTPANSIAQAKLCSMTVLAGL